MKFILIDNEKASYLNDNASDYIRSIHSSDERKDGKPSVLVLSYEDIIPESNRVLRNPFSFKVTYEAQQNVDIVLFDHGNCDIEVLSNRLTEETLESLLEDIKATRTPYGKLMTGLIRILAHSTGDIEKLNGYLKKMLSTKGCNDYCENYQVNGRYEDREPSTCKIGASMYSHSGCRYFKTANIRLESMKKDIVKKFIDNHPSYKSIRVDLEQDIFELVFGGTDK